MSIEIEAAQGVGAYISNVNLSKLDDATVKQLRSALGEYGVLFFRGQDMSPEDHIKMAESFGTINISWHRALNDYPGERRFMHRITVEGCELEGAFQ